MEKTAPRGKIVPDVLIAEGSVAGEPFQIRVPEGFTGKVSLVINVHRGCPSKRVRKVVEGVADLGRLPLGTDPTWNRATQGRPGT